MRRKIKLMFFGFAFVFLGVAIFSLKFMRGFDVRLPLWPFDGIAAVAGGILIIWWSWKVMNESEEDTNQTEDAQT